MLIPITFSQIDCTKAIPLLPGPPLTDDDDDDGSDYIKPRPEGDVEPGSVPDGHANDPTTTTSSDQLINIPGSSAVYAGDMDEPTSSVFTPQLERRRKKRNTAARMRT